MAYENLGKCIALPSSGDLSERQYRFVRLNSSGQIVLVGSVGGTAIGVLQDKPTAANQAASVMVGPGVTKIVAGGNFNAGDDLKSDGQGRAISAGGSDALGYALEANTSGEGAIVSMLFQR